MLNARLVLLKCISTKYKPKPAVAFLMELFYLFQMITSFLR